MPQKRHCIIMLYYVHNRDVMYTWYKMGLAKTDLLYKGAAIYYWWGLQKFEGVEIFWDQGGG